MLFIGRFVEVKNVYFILSCLKELFKINKDFNFIFLGYGPEQSKMQKIVKENGMVIIYQFLHSIDTYLFKFITLYERLKLFNNK